MEKHEQWQYVMIITKFILSTLIVCLGPKNKKLVLNKIIFHAMVREFLLDHILPIKVTITQQEVLIGMMKALNESWNSTSNVRFATRHVILTVVVSIHSSFLMWDVAKALGIHHRNVLAAISRCKVMDDSGFALWSLYVKKKKDLWVAWIIEKGSTGMVDFIDTSEFEKKMMLHVNNWNRWCMMKNLCTSSSKLRWLRLTFLENFISKFVCTYNSIFNVPTLKSYVPIFIKLFFL